MRQGEPSPEINFATVSTRRTTTKTALVWGMRPAHFALLAVVLVMFFRLSYVRYVDLVPDEAIACPPP